MLGTFDVSIKFRKFQKLTNHSRLVLVLLSAGPEVNLNGSSAIPELCRQANTVSE